MIQRSLFRKNYVIFASIVLVSIFLAISTSWILTSFERDRMFLRPANMHRNLLKAFDEDPLKALPKLNALAEENNMPPSDLIDDKGVSIVSGKKVLDKPLTAEQLVGIEKDQSVQVGGGLTAGPPIVISQTQKTGMYLYSEMRPPGGKPPSGPLVTLISMIACILISIGVALFYQFSKYQARSDEAVRVLNGMREGNLSARMPIKKLDELAPLVGAFNQMAGDLEHMVEQMRKADRARRHLLQDLAHDLRTPLTSLRTFLETMQSAGSRLKEEQRQEILDLSFSEVEYFGKLVEDLLFLAQISEPQYSLGTEVIDVRESLNEQLMIFKRRYPNLNFETSISGNSFAVRGSAQLLDRLLRNAVENSASFAKSKLQIHLHDEGSVLNIILTDDGPGFSEKALAEFGYKKASRVLTKEANSSRISVGIGSVIMREISQLHGGDLKAENALQNGTILGARVSISLKKS
jgi:signal transduction histidine kinase